MIGGSNGSNRFSPPSMSNVVGTANQSQNSPLAVSMGIGGSSSGGGGIGPSWKVDADASYASQAQFIHSHLDGGKEFIKKVKEEEEAVENDDDPQIWEDNAGGDPIEDYVRGLLKDDEDLDDEKVETSGGVVREGQAVSATKGVDYADDFDS